MEDAVKDVDWVTESVHKRARSMTIDIRTKKLSSFSRVERLIKSCRISSTIAVLATTSISLLNMPSCYTMQKALPISEPQ